MADKVISNWRMMYVDGQHGMFVWFDPFREHLSIRDLTEDEKAVTFDKLSSVSGLDEDEDSVESNGCKLAKGESFTQLGFWEGQ